MKPTFALIAAPAASLMAASKSTIMAAFNPALMAALIVAAILMAGCKKFEINDDDQWPMVKSGKISEQEFNEKVKGHGWESGLTYRIVKGKVTDEDMDSMSGFSSSDYYFDEGTLTQFLYRGDIPASGYYIKSYEYNESDCSIYINGYKSMTIVKVTKNKFEAIKDVGVKSDGTKVFGYVTYTLMSEDKLAKTRESHKVDLDTVGR